MILTELGIAVFNEGKLEKTFPFKDPVDEYLTIKKKDTEPDGLIRYLSEIPTGVKSNDESLFALLKKSSVDVRMMEEEELEEIQTTKPQIMADSGFAKDAREALEKLRDFSRGLSSSKITEFSGSPDLHIIQATIALDEIDKIANMLSSAMREWYGMHFPELENIIDSTNGYAHVVVAGRRDMLTREVFKGITFPESKIEMILLAASNSMGGDISDAGLSIVQSIAGQIVEFDRLKKKIVEYVESQMSAHAPNMSAILGHTVGAKILRKAGSLQRVASMPASTVQVLGAEKALFRALKTGSRAPKHGLLFQHEMVHSAPRWQRGKIARAIAAKAVIAARVDMYGEGLNKTLLERLNIRVGEIGKRYEHPVEKKSEPGIRKGEDFRRPKGSVGRENFKNRYGTKSKKRKKAGRR